MTLLPPADRKRPPRPSALCPTLLAAALGAGVPAAEGAQTTAKTAARAAAKALPAKPPAAKAQRSTVKAPVKVEPPAPAIDLPPAEAEQISAAEQVYYGIYDCEFKQTINIVANAEHFGYVDVKHGKVDYLMKPVLSSTGAIRLEDVRGETLMVQIAAKSMLLNVKTAQRVVDDCISPKQRELMEAARAARAEAAAKAAAAAASGPEATPAGPPAGPGPLLAAPLAAGADTAASAPR